MQDRVPTKPNRILIKPEDGSPSFYATMTRADEPTQVGDPLNKNTFLKDETAALFGFGKTAVPDDVFAKIPLLFNEQKEEVLSIPRTTVKVGSYVGNGKSESLANANTLEFDFKPMFIVVYSPPTGADGGSLMQIPLFMIRGHNGTSGGSVSWGFNTAVWKENSVSWYADTAQHQRNESGRTYAYFAVGVLEVE